LMIFDSFQQSLFQTFSISFMNLPISFCNVTKYLRSFISHTDHIELITCIKVRKTQSWATNFTNVSLNRKYIEKLCVKNPRSDFNECTFWSFIDNLWERLHDLFQSSDPVIKILNTFDILG
jgi:hypothetical protein